MNIRGCENLPGRALPLRLISMWHAIRAANSALGGTNEIKEHLSLAAPHQVLRPFKGLRDIDSAPINKLEGALDFHADFRREAAPL